MRNQVVSHEDWLMHLRLRLEYVGPAAIGPDVQTNQTGTAPSIVVRCIRRRCGRL